MASSAHKQNQLLKWAVHFGWGYLILLMGWLAAFALGGDWGGLLAPLNALACWLFLPLPLFIGMAAATRRIGLGLAGAVGLAASLYLWGGLFLPGPEQASALSGASSTSLRVMTYNVYGFNNDQTGVIAAIRSADPDIVCLQELNYETAAALLDVLGGEYPYMVLDPSSGVKGMGTISKYPLRSSGQTLPLLWVGTPQLLELDWSGREITLVNFHMHPPGQLSPGSLRQRHAIRLAQAAVLAQLAAEVEQPLLLAGDANATDLNEVYQVITLAGLRDAWREVGQGMGFTFPRQLGSLSPAWMTRIDHVFLSSQWLIQTAKLAPVDGSSDHRGVVVEAGLPSD